MSLHKQESGHRSNVMWSQQQGMTSLVLDRVSLGPPHGRAPSGEEARRAWSRYPGQCYPWRALIALPRVWFMSWFSSLEVFQKIAVLNLKVSPEQKDVVSHSVLVSVVSTSAEFRDADTICCFQNQGSLHWPQRKASVLLHLAGLMGYLYFFLFFVANSIAFDLMLLIFFFISSLIS